MGGKFYREGGGGEKWGSKEGLEKPEGKERGATFDKKKKKRAAWRKHSFNQEEARGLEKEPGKNEGKRRAVGTLSPAERESGKNVSNIERKKKTFDR